MKIILKIFNISLVSCLIVVCLLVPVSAEENIKSIEKTPTGTVTEIETGSKYLRKAYVEENGIENIIEYDGINRILKIDGEVITIQYKFEDINPMYRSTIDYTSGVNAGVKIPWKGTLTATATVITFILSGGYAALGVDVITGFLTSEAGDYWITYTLYRSKESYYSNWEGTYYNQYKWSNIRIRRDSKTGPVVYGPYEGAWYDPIRP